MSFYKKVTQTLIPESIHNLAAHHGSGEEKSERAANESESEKRSSINNDADSTSAKERSTYHSMSGRISYEDDDSDDDVARLDEGSNFFTGLLNSTTLCSGLGPLNSLKKQYLDDFIKKSGLHSLKPQQLLLLLQPQEQQHHHHHHLLHPLGKHDKNPSISDSLNSPRDLSLSRMQQFSSEDSDASEDSEDEEHGGNEDEEFVANNLKATKISDNNVPTTTVTEPPAEATPIEKIETVASTTTAATTTAASVTQVKVATETKVAQIPEEVLEELNPLQRSVVTNLDPHSIKEGILIKVKPAEQQTEEDIRNEHEKIKEKIQLRLKIADKLQKVFGLGDNDVFLGNYSAWLIKDVLLQGHLYLTKEALLYFAFLPKRFSFEHASEVLNTDDSSNIVHKGTLGFKSGKYGEAIINAVVQHRYWAVLRSETLSIYSSATDLYFPVLVIDIKTCLYAEVIDKEKYGKEAISPLNRSGAQSPRGSMSGTSTPRSSTLEDSASELNNMLSGDTFSPTEDNIESGSTDVWFKLVTKKKTYKFHCDSSFSARQWCNNLTKLIFQHNNANTCSEVLIKIPIDDIVEFNKRTLFNEEADYDIDAATNDIPLNLSIKYVTSVPAAVDAKKKKDKPRRKSKADDDVAIEEVNFLFPKNGVEFFETFDKVMNNGQEKVDVLSRLSSRESTTSMRSMSTLRPSTNSLVKTVQDYNRFDPGSDDASTLKKLSKTITSPTRIFRALTLGSQDRPSIASVTSKDGLDTDSHLQLPRALSERGLQSLDISFVTSLKKMEEASSRYEKPEFSPDELPLPSNLTDPFEVKKESRRPILKSIKALTNVGSRWSATPLHYVDDGKYYVEKPKEREESQRNFQSHFSTNSKLVAAYYGHLIRTVPVYGKFYVSETEICFRSLLPGVSTKMVLPLMDVENVKLGSLLKLTYHGLVLIVHGAEELNVEFGSSKARDDFQEMALGQLEKLHSNEGYRPKPHEWGSNYDLELSKTRMEYTDSERFALQNAFDDTLKDVQLAEQRIELARVRMFEDRLMAASGLDVPIILEDSPFFKTEMKPSTSYNITLLTIGSRGDVQPYMALGKGLVKEGHNVTIATHGEFGDWIKKSGLNFKEIAGNPAELMSFMVTHNTMSVGFLKDAQKKFKSWIATLLTTSWKACQGSDILIESPSAMAGIHIAEALGIPYFRAFTMPWTRTRAYPHAFFVPDQKKGGSYNYLTHVLFENIFWKGISGQVNKWRVQELDLPKTNLYRLQQTRVPFLYNVSLTVLPPAVDFPDWIKVTGYWFLDEGSGDYKPPEELVKFMSDAAADGKKIVYIGFGSIVVKDAKSLTKAVVEAVKRADVRCILNKGWSDRLDKKGKDDIEVELPPEVYNSGAIPHDWLFPRVDAAVHHGGSGTTGASLRAGTPTIIKPFFGDQFFYATRVEDLGAGLGLKKLTAKTLANALVTVTEDLKIIEKAKRVSEQIKHEHGVLSAIEAIYSELEYSRNLILVKDIYNQNYKRHHPDFRSQSGIQSPVELSDDEEEDEEDSDEDDDEDNEDYEDESSDQRSKAS
ncbi:Sterol 3-beta-glucosyltransferase [Candida viswanathii]|uniref:Sterol 3-beta-glucosyltransferase n=1 Tax=Candida viswanathii TaxID=5486 RepID=A0A367XZN1_9ASCO|nr:Sterol 3-beta-glucosyltransferase [Candida viswanathii]